MGPSTFSRGDVGDGREKALLQHVLSQAEQGNPQSVLQAVDEFAHRTWLMNVGDEKGLLLDSALQSCNPRIALEIGAYCDYSAVRIASQLNGPDCRLVSVEMNPDNAEITRKVVQHAGLSHKVSVVAGVLSEGLEKVGNMLKELKATGFDFVFLDHHKQYYLSDLLQLKEGGFLKTGKS